jgi:hypothetical protein
MWLLAVLVEWSVSPVIDNQTSIARFATMFDRPDDALRADAAEVKRTIELLFTPGTVVEGRMLKTTFGTMSGSFDDRAALVAAICEAERQFQPPGIYWTLNPIDPALLARARNRWEKYARYTTADNNITRRLRLPVDVDPVRPAGISSSDEEHETAIQRAHLIAEEMAASWGRPLIADSGNGAHLLYKIDLPNDAESLALVSSALAELDRRYSDDVVKVDVTCSNAARIWRVYGTVSRKGDSMPDRPHRISRIIEVPNDFA